MIPKVEFGGTVEPISEDVALLLLDLCLLHEGTRDVRKTEVLALALLLDCLETCLRWLG